MVNSCSDCEGYFTDATSSNFHVNHSFSMNSFSLHSFSSHRLLALTASADAVKDVLKEETKKMKKKKKKETSIVAAAEKLRNQKQSALFFPIFLHITPKGKKRKKWRW